TTTTTAITATTETTTATTTTTRTTTTTSSAADIWSLTIPTYATWNQTGITVAGNSNGTNGSDLGSLSTPVSIFIDNNYTLYVCDRDNNRIVKYYAYATVGILVAGNRTKGNDLSELWSPKGVAVDQYGNVIIADSSNYRIQKFPPGSTVGITVAINSSAISIGVMRDLHINVNNVIVITDSTYSRVVKFNASGGVGAIIAGINGVGSGSNQFSSPFGNFIDENETLYVADSGNQRIQMWPAGVNSGITVAGINNSSGSSLGQLSSPNAIVIDNNGYASCRKVCIA
ncbi:unnamed protein product, partial [Rotaria magnacalcarata]